MAEPVMFRSREPRPDLIDPREPFDPRGLRLAIGIDLLAWAIIAVALWVVFA